jgi:hypothetical protein
MLFRNFKEEEEEEEKKEKKKKKKKKKKKTHGMERFGYLPNATLQCSA